ncbi:ComEA family DNA-binding protein [Streptomyces sp. ISL-66]|uniref:ComEA family DNA-binding protein n=1 Tax=Streptomyces sp. ISL-66 TaxID=2819186 RepID=UPI001BEC878B|nr:ComEA family DNA-binding protein [Streptomyces sp. ISL-66]MBT2467497.1 ComEA family DNA-binding protein [Streptomyces sp. ISL-66]
MTLRTRDSSPVGATSGPGRPRLSDSRLRHRRGHRARHPEPAAVRRRAEAMLGVPPPGAPAPAVGLAPALGTVPAAAQVAAQAPPSAGTGAGSASVPPGGGPATLLPEAEARWLAVRERLPGWLQARCGVEPRTVAAVSVVLAVAAGFAGYQYWSARPQPVTAPALVAPVPVPVPAAAGMGTGTGTGAAAGRILVDVSGKVRDPGVRRLPAGSRVEDALVAAGGVRPGTDITGLNRARVLMDGEQVLVGAPAPPPVGGGAPAPGPGSGPLSLGTATAEQLDGLPGVGPVLAQHIVDFRTARGGFRSVEELRQVNGIGERRFADLRKLVRP